jgi:uncharacterized membrane protein YphA (DoxX/SURF4 family)
MARWLWRIVAVLLPLCAAASTASAHEVYVLDPATVSLDVANPSPNPFTMAITDFPHFSLRGIIAVITVAVIFLISVSRKIEDFLCPTLIAIKPYASLIARITLGVSLLFSASHAALFGPELPLFQLAPTYALYLQTILYVAGFLVLFGLFTRFAALLALGVYAVAVWHNGIYMLTYLNYFGEILVSLMLGSGAWSADSYRGAGKVKKIRFRKLCKQMEHYAFFVLRVCFGIAVLYASWYAKFWHSQLALDTVVRYHLTNYFHFAPLFVVLGAFIIETLIGVFFILGIEIRFTSLFFLTFLGLSLWYFGEAVWPHAILIGVNIALLVHGYDRYSLEGRFFNKRSREPIF